MKGLQGLGWQNCGRVSTGHTVTPSTNTPFELYTRGLLGSGGGGGV